MFFNSSIPLEFVHMDLMVIRGRNSRLERQESREEENECQNALSMDGCEVQQSPESAASFTNKRRTRYQRCSQ